MFFDDLISKFKSWFDKDTTKLVGKLLPSTQVDKPADYVPLVLGRHYIKLWLADMHLTKQVEWMKQVFPAMHAVVRFDFGTEKVEVPAVADAQRAQLKQGAAGDFFVRNFELTPYIPYNSGTLELNAGLVAVQGANYLNDFIGTLSNFAKLVNVPQFSAALDIAAPLAQGVQSLLATGSVRIALHQTFSKGSMGGYFVVVRGGEGDGVGTVDANKLMVVDNSLCYGSGPNENDTVPYGDLDYMLFRIEVQEELSHDTWMNLPSIHEPYSKIEQAYSEGDPDKAESYYRATIVAIREAKELTTAQRVQACEATKTDYQTLMGELKPKGIERGAAAVEKAMRSASLFDSIQRNGLSVTRALKKGEVTDAELVVVPPAKTAKAKRIAHQ